MLKHARENIEKSKTIAQDPPIFNSNDNPHIGHLSCLSRRNVHQRYDHLLDNFQTAAMHLYFMMTMPGKMPDGTLPDLPDELRDLLSISPVL